MRYPVLLVVFFVVVFVAAAVLALLALVDTGSAHRFDFLCWSGLVGFVGAFLYVLAHPHTRHL